MIPAPFTEVTAAAFAISDRGDIVLILGDLEFCFFSCRIVKPLAVAVPIEIPDLKFFGSMVVLLSDPVVLSTRSANQRTVSCFAFCLKLKTHVY